MSRRTAARLPEVGERGGQSADESFWRPAAARYLAPLLMAAAHDGAGMRDVLEWIARSDDDTPRGALEACGAESAATDALQSVAEADPRFRSSVLQTAATALDAWQEPRVAAATGGRPSDSPTKTNAALNPLFTSNMTPYGEVKSTWPPGSSSPTPHRQTPT